MTTPTRPTNISLPFASDGTKNTIPTASTGTGKASFEDGFPPVTMLPIAGGGVPPEGKDFNGILYDITTHTLWVNAGGQYQFDAALSTAIGGYPKGMVLQSDDGLSSYVSAIDNNTTDFNTTPSSIGTDWLKWAGGVKANLDSPAFTGNPTAPTPDPGDNDTSIATTEFVKEAIDNAIAAAGTPLYQLYFMGQL